MRKLIFLGSLFCSIPIFSQLQVDDIDFDINPLKWQIRKKCDVDDISCFHIYNWHDDISLRFTARSIESTNLEAFNETLQPYEDHLLPFMTANWSEKANYDLLLEEDTYLLDFPAKLLKFEVSLSSGRKEIILAYLTITEKKSFFSSSLTARTLSFCSEKSSFVKNKEVITSVIDGCKIL